MDPKLKRLLSEFDALRRKIGSSHGLPTEPIGDGTPHVEIVNDDYHFVASERGTEFDRRSTNDPSELLYWIFSGITHSMASSYEVTHRVRGQSFRRLMFSKQLELLQELNPEWAAKRKKEIDAILLKHP